MWLALTHGMWWEWQVSPPGGGFKSPHGTSPCDRDQQCSKSIWESRTPTSDLGIYCNDNKFVLPRYTSALTETLPKVSNGVSLGIFILHWGVRRRVIKLRIHPKSFRPAGSLTTLIKLKKVLVQRVLRPSVLHLHWGQRRWNKPKPLPKGFKWDEPNLLKVRGWNLPPDALLKSAKMPPGLTVCSESARRQGPRGAAPVALGECLLALWFYIFNPGWLEDSFIHLTRFSQGVNSPQR